MYYLNSPDDYREWERFLRELQANLWTMEPPTDTDTTDVEAFLDTLDDLDLEIP